VPEPLAVGGETGDRGGEHSLTLPGVEDDVLVALVLEPSEDPIEPTRVTRLVGNRLEVAVSDERVGLAKLLDDLLDDGIEAFPLVIEAVPGVVPSRVMVKTPTSFPPRVNVARIRSCFHRGGGMPERRIWGSLLSPSGHPHTSTIRSNSSYTWRCRSPSGQLQGRGTGGTSGQGSAISTFRSPSRRPHGPTTYDGLDE
jgi:hypothetical protein